MAMRFVAVMFLLGAIVACSSSSSTGAGGGSGASTGLPACTWPASLDGTDASNGQCVAARALLSCPLTGGGTQGCISNDPKQCPSGGPQAGSPPGACEDKCQPNEFAIKCGTIGPGNPDAAPPPSPPAGCHNEMVTPAGIYFECCPCGS